jgi:hypothetical protein
MKSACDHAGWCRRPLFLTALLLVAATAAGAGLLFAWRAAPQHWPRQPLQHAPTARTVRPADWAELTLAGGPGGNDWVLLPDQPQQPPFQSPITAAQRGFLAPQDCVECHADYCDTFQHTSHARTSSLPSTDTILGSLQPGHNVLTTARPELQFRMHAQNGSIVQTVELQYPPLRTVFTDSFPIDLVFGSGNHGQSYLWWNSDRLYQAHVSYLSEGDAWINSPGPYYDGTVDFSRPVPLRCMECHVTWIGADPQEMNRFDRQTLIPGVTCVRCHGPAHEHVAFHRQHPEETRGKRIVNPAALSIERQNEICAQCHSAGEEHSSLFSYRPGEPLQQWLQPDLSASAESNADPHSANQLARLMQSPCFQQSGGFACTLCHDPHQNQSGSATYAQHCRSCHQQNSCPEVQHPDTGSLAETRCVVCHMPARRDAQVAMQTRHGNIEALLRDHQIGIWPATATAERAKLADTLRQALQPQNNPQHSPGAQEGTAP